MNTLQKIFEKRAEQFYGHDPWRYGESLSKRCDDIELNWIFNNIHFITKDKILDVGCGTGRHIMKFASYLPCKHYYGCDFVQKNIDFINNEIKNNTLKNITVACGDGQQFHKIFSKILFDMIFMIGFTQYIIDDKELQQFVNHCYNTTTDNGLLILKHPLSFSNSFIFKGYSKFLKSEYVSNYRNLTDMIRLFKGFELIRMDRIFTKDNLGSNLSIVETSDQTKQMWMVFKKL